LEANSTRTTPAPEGSSGAPSLDDLMARLVAIEERLDRIGWPASATDEGVSALEQLDARCDGLAEELNAITDGVGRVRATSVAVVDKEGRTRVEMFGGAHTDDAVSGAELHGPDGALTASLYQTDGWEEDGRRAAPYAELAFGRELELKIGVEDGLPVLRYYKRDDPTTPIDVAEHLFGYLTGEGRPPWGIEHLSIRAEQVMAALRLVGDTIATTMETTCSSISGATFANELPSLDEDTARIAGRPPREQ
jgi:hypothetical protein